MGPTLGTGLVEPEQLSCAAGGDHNRGLDRITEAWSPVGETTGAWTGFQGLGLLLMRPQQGLGEAFNVSQTAGIPLPAVGCSHHPQALTICPHSP